MAKRPVTKSGTSRVRFIMLDAEIAEGDLSQITAAIQNALKPQAMIVQQKLSHHVTGGAMNTIEAEADFSEDFSAPDEEIQEQTPVPRPARPPRSRKPTVPKVLELDLKSEVSFESFASEHNPQNEVDRNLLILAWFHLHRPDEMVTVNHVYTCYRAIKWPSGIEDFSWPLRALKKKQFISSLGLGKYEINHLGIDRVENMRVAK